MVIKTIKYVAATFLLALAIDAGVSAQESMSAEKRALIQELLVLTEAAKMTENMVNTILLQTEKDLPRIVLQTHSQEINANVLTSHEQRELEKAVNDVAARVSTRFRQMLPQRVDFTRLVEQISVPLYHKYFSEGELRDLVAFYRSPTGKKSISVFPQLSSEAMQRSSELLMPKVLQLIKEIMQEEKKHLKK